MNKHETLLQDSLNTRNPNQEEIREINSLSANLIEKQAKSAVAIKKVAIRLGLAEITGFNRDTGQVSDSENQLVDGKFLEPDELVNITTLIDSANLLVLERAEKLHEVKKACGAMVKAELSADFRWVNPVTGQLLVE